MNRFATALATAAASVVLATVGLGGAAFANMDSFSPSLPIGPGTFGPDPKPALPKGPMTIAPKALPDIPPIGPATFAPKPGFPKPLPTDLAPAPKDTPAPAPTKDPKVATPAPAAPADHGKGKVAPKPASTSSAPADVQTDAAAQVAVQPFGQASNGMSPFLYGALGALLIAVGALTAVALRRKL